MITTLRSQGTFEERLAFLLEPVEVGEVVVGGGGEDVEARGARTEDFESLTTKACVNVKACKSARSTRTEKQSFIREEIFVNALKKAPAGT